MEVVRTPDERFDGLPDWPYAPHDAEVGAGDDRLRMAYVDEGPRDARAEHEGRFCASAPNRAAWEVLQRFEKPFVCAFGASDPVTKGADAALRELIPGTRGQPHETLVGAAHFSQEDAGPRLAEIVASVAAAGRGAGG